MRTKKLLANATNEVEATAALEQALNPQPGRDKPWSLDAVKRHGSPAVISLIAKLAQPRVPEKTKRARKSVAAIALEEGRDVAEVKAAKAKGKVKRTRKSRKAK